MSLRDFHILSEIGNGSFANVLKVRRIQDGKIYALKKVKLWSLSEKEKQNSLNQIRILASVKNSNIIQYKQAFLDSESATLCLVTQFADDGDLERKMKQVKQNQQKFGEDKIWCFMKQLARGLKGLHLSNIIHRDLKVCFLLFQSANIFMFRDNRVKIGDMNVSKVIKQSMLETQTGTPYYASPQVWKDLPYNEKSDIWSLGCILFEMMMLHPPFMAESMEELYKKVVKGIYPKIKNQYSKGLRNLVRMMLQVNPNSRPDITTILDYIQQETNREEKEQNYCLEEQNIYGKKKKHSKLTIKTAKSIPLDLEDNEEEEKANELISTIKMPTKMNLLSEKLPKSNYCGQTEKDNFHLPFIKKKTSIRLLPSIDRPVGIRRKLNKVRSEKTISLVPHEREFSKNK